MITSSSVSSNESELRAKSKFGKFLDYVWPIHKHELPKFLLLTLLMFCILFIQNLVRALKDGIVNTMIGTEIISFLKFWGVLPAAFLMTIIYVKLVNTLKNENIFYIILSFFILFFLLFAFWIFPNYQTLHLDTNTTQALVFKYPHFKWFIYLFSNWSFSLFYIIAELWPNAIFALLYWQFVNMVTSVEESKRFYTLFGLLGQTGLYMSGKFLSFVPELSAYCLQHYQLSCTKTTLSVQFIISVVGLLGVIALITFWVLNHIVLDMTEINLKFKVKSSGMSVKEGIKMAIESRYIRLIATLLICYGLSINLVESPWKSQATSLYTTTEEYAAFVGRYLSYTGILTVIFVLIGSNIVRHLGWFLAAIITPIMVLVSGLCFFLVSNFSVASYLATFSLFMTSPSSLAITIGAIQNVLSKSTKYTLFDSTKEMAYVPLDNELKTKGKAAADVVGVKLGKSASSLIQFLVFSCFPFASYQSISSYLMFVFVIVCLVWVWAVRELNVEYTRLVNKIES